MKKFAVFDIDGTLFRSGLYREVAHELMKMGVLDESITMRTTEKNREWRHRLHANAFEEFEKLLVESIDSALPHLRTADYDRAVQRVIEKKADNVYVYTRDLLKSLKARGYFLIAISGSQLELVEPFAKKYGFDTWVGQEWERDGEFFTGNVIKSHTNKDAILRPLIQSHNLTLTDSYAIGDSNGDRGMLALVEHPIAFNPTSELYEAAVTQGWTIVVERKSMQYTLEQNDAGAYCLTHTNHEVH